MFSFPYDVPSAYFTRADTENMTAATTSSSAGTGRINPIFSTTSKDLRVRTVMHCITIRKLTRALNWVCSVGHTIINERPDDLVS